MTSKVLVNPFFNQVKIKLITIFRVHGDHDTEQCIWAISEKMAKKRDIGAKK